MDGHHRRIGAHFLGWITGAFLLGVLLAAYVKIMALGGSEGGPEGQTRLVRQLLTYHGLVMVFLCVVPAIPAILGHFLLPGLLGADGLSRPGLALPGLATAGLRLYALGAIVLMLSVARGAVATGWTLSPSLALVEGGAFTLVAVGLFLVAASWFLIGVNFIVTVHHRRGAGVGFFDLPPAAWGIYLGAYQLVVAGILFAIIVLYLASARAFGTGLFSDQTDPLIWQNYFWFALRPAAVMALVPAAGVMSEVITRISRKPLAAYRTVVWSLIALLGLSFAGWGLHLVGRGQEPSLSFVFAVFNLLAVVPVALIAYSWLATLHRGAIVGGAATTLVVAFMLQAGIGVLLGLLQSNLALSSYLGETIFATAHLHYVLMGGVLTALLAGLYHWWPELIGAGAAEGGGRLAAYLYLIGLNLAFFPQIVMGLHGQPPSVPVASGLVGWQTLSQAGMALLILAVILIAVNLIAALIRSRSAPVSGR